MTKPSNPVSRFMKNTLVFLFLAWAGLAVAQSPSLNIERTLTWAPQPMQQTFTNGDVQEFWTFDGCIFEARTPSLPAFTQRFPLSGRATLSVEVVAVQY